MRSCVGAGSLTFVPRRRVVSKIVSLEKHKPFRPSQDHAEGCLHFVLRAPTTVHRPGGASWGLLGPSSGPLGATVEPL